MKLSLRTQELLSKLQAVSRVASTRTAIMALSGVKLTTMQDGCELAATDTEVGLKTRLSAEVGSEGAVVLPSRLLVDVVRALPEDHLSIERESADGAVVIRCGGATFRLRTLRLEDFPNLPEPSPEKVMMPTQVFVTTIAKVARSASHDETRPVLTGILVSAADSELVMVATDSYRLSVQRTALSCALSGSFEANVPARALQELARIAQSEEGSELAISRHGSQVIFEVGDAVLYSRLIDGQFPNYRKLLPSSVEHELVLSTAELRGVVRRVSLLAQKNSPIELRFSDGELSVSAQTPDVGEATESIPVPFKGEPFEIGFNPEFLRDGLETVDTDELVLKLISPLRPGLIETPGSGDFVYLVMPIRLTG